MTLFVSKLILIFGLPTQLTLSPKGELQEKYVIHDMKLFKSSAIVMSVVIVMFFLHSVVHVSMVRRHMKLMNSSR